MGCLFEPSSDGIPGDLLYPCECRLVQALDAERGDFVEGRATVLESIVWRTGVPAEMSSHKSGTDIEDASQSWSVEAMEDHASGTGISRQTTFPVWTVTFFIVPEARGPWN
jgi:hypothetical protein